ncbi:MAG TPA: YfhO family protein [Thermoanaerobaculaceae bacterium]|nr:YfhO family protein [Thermoanaerobaculaceae bacterium]
MDLTTAAWILVPLVLVHLAERRRRELMLFQVLVDILLVLLPGRLVARGWHLGPGAPGGPSWGGVATVAGIPEQIDVPLQFDVWWEEVRRLVASGEPPWVSDRLGGGMPLLANGQTQLPFPLHLPVWLLGAQRGTDVMVLWKLELGALGAFLMLRRWRLRAVAAATGAIAFGFGVYPLSWTVVPLAWVVAALPWSMWSLTGALRGDGRSAAALALTLGVMAGWSVHPETAGFLWLAVGSTGATLAWGRVRRLRRLAAPFVMALAVTGIGAVPTALTVRGTSKLAGMQVAPHYPMPIMDREVRAQLASHLLVPWRDGHPSDGTWRSPYPAAVLVLGVGAAPFLLIGAGSPRRRLRRVWLGFAALGTWAVVFIWQPPVVAGLVGRLPVLGVMTWPRAGFLVGFTLAGLGAVALDGLLRRPRRVRLLVATVVVQAVVLLLVATAPAGVPRRHLLPLASVPALVGLVGLAGGGAMVPVLVAAEAGLAGWQVIAAAPGPSAIPSGSALAELVRLQGAEGGRIVGIHEALPPNRAAAMGLADLRGSDPVRSLALARLHQALGSGGLDLPGPVTRPWAGLAGCWGVRFLAATPEDLPGEVAEGWSAVMSEAGGRIFRNSRALPVVRLATQMVASPGDPGNGAWETVDFASTAVGEDPVVLGGQGTLDVTEERPWRWQAKVRADGPVLAVLHVPEARGWRVYLDGRKAAIRRVNLAAMAVLVPAGAHRVRWEYQPPGLLLGGALSVAGLVGCLLMALGGLRRPGRSPRRQGTRLRGGPGPGG